MWEPMEEGTWEALVGSGDQDLDKCCLSGDWESFLTSVSTLVKWDLELGWHCSEAHRPVCALALALALGPVVSEEKDNHVINHPYQGNFGSELKPNNSYPGTTRGNGDCPGPLPESLPGQDPVLRCITSQGGWCGPSISQVQRSGAGQ